MKFKAIMAMDKNGTVGNGFELPWVGDLDTKFDMTHFKETTSNHIVIMGYNTFKSFKRPLRNRLNLVIGRPQEGEKFYSLKDSIEGYSGFNGHLSDYIKGVAEEVEIVPGSDLEAGPNNNSNLVNMTKNGLSTLFNFIPLETIDYRFVYISKDVLLDDVKRNFEFDHLNRNFVAAKDIAVDAYKNSGMNDDSIAKLKKMDLTEAYIIGGATTYERYIDLIDEFIVTRFNKSWDGDIKFNQELLKQFPNQEVLVDDPNGQIIKYSR